MARTPAMDALLRAIRTARFARRAGIPPAEAAGLRDAAITRRRLLRAGAAAAGAAILHGCAAPRGEPEIPAPERTSVRVAVVGGGLAGLHCAWRLGKLGVAADVFEASGRVGGRVFSDRTSFGSLSCELGGELVDSNHETMHALAAEFGLELLDFTTDDPAVAPWIAHVGGRRVPEGELLEGLAPILAKVDAAVEPLGEEDVTRDGPAATVPLDRLSIREWLDGAGAEGPARAFLEVAYLTEYGLETDDASALDLLTMIGTDPEAFAVFGESDERYRFRTGNETVTERLAAGLGEGRLHRASALVAVRRAPDGRVILTFDRGTLLGAREVAADRAVIAIPFTLLRGVELDPGLDLPEPQRRAIAELGYGTSAKLMAGFASKPWRAAGSNGEVFTDLPFQCSWETSRLQPGAAGILTNFTGGRHGAGLGTGPVAERAREFLGGLERVFPGARNAHDGRAVRMHWPTHAWTKGGYASYRVGQWTTLRGAEGMASGNLHFCGEHTSLDFQGFMEGAAESGARAAAEVAEALGVEAGKAPPR
jgi:monoamine oxidase